MNNMVEVCTLSYGKVSTRECWDCLVSLLLSRAESNVVSASGELGTEKASPKGAEHTQNQKISQT